MNGTYQDIIGLARHDLLRETAYIDGLWTAGTARISVTDPATGRVLGTVPNLGRDDAEAAVAAAACALPDWRARRAGDRAALLMRWVALVRAHREDLARLLSAEQGKPLAEARGEIDYAAGFIQWFAEEARRIYGEIVPPPVTGRKLLVQREAVGVVSAITPWNFPAAMITRKAAPALAAGCTMVLKPSEITPFSALALAVLAEEAGIPAGVFNVVTGDPGPIGDVLVEDPRIAKFSFTGSTAVGKSLAARCMGTVKRVSLELGGNAPFIVFDDADLDLAVDGAIAAKFRNAGQTCVCANRFYVQEGVRAAFLEKLAARVSDLRIERGLSDRSDIGPLIDARAVRKAAAHVEDALAGGARLLVGGTSIPGPGHFFAPTILDDVRPDALLCREETFGPVVGIIGFTDETAMVSMANGTPTGLAAYLYTRDLSRAHRIGDALEFGMVGINCGTISTEVIPFGGIKESGFGREGSRHGIDEYTHLKLLSIAI